MTRRGWGPPAVVTDWSTFHSHFIPFIPPEPGPHRGPAEAPEELGWQLQVSGQPRGSRRSLGERGGEAALALRQGAASLSGEPGAPGAAQEVTDRSRSTHDVPEGCTTLLTWKTCLMSIYQPLVDVRSHASSLAVRQRSSRASTDFKTIRRNWSTSAPPSSTQRQPATWKPERFTWTPKTN